MENKENCSVKVYFINPIESISVLVDALINLEFEVYTLPAADRDKLLKVIPKKNCRVIIFFSVTNKIEQKEWLQYADSVKAINHPNLQLGSFCYNSISEEEKINFLTQNVPVMLFSFIEKNTLEVLQNLLMIFEAKDKKGFVRVKALGDADVSFYFKEKKNPVAMKIKDISVYAFSLEIDPMNKDHFKIGAYLDNVLIVLLGVRLRLTVKVLGFSTANPNIYIFKNCSSKIIDNKVVYMDKIPNEANLKIHNFIRKSLKRDMAKLLAATE